MILDQFGRPVLYTGRFAIPGWAHREAMRLLARNLEMGRHLDVQLRIEHLRRSCGQPDEQIVVGASVGIRLPQRSRCTMDRTGPCC